MDYAPPPELEAQYAFVEKTKSHFSWRGLFGAFAPTFSRSDLQSLDEQGKPHAEACLRQLKDTGVCVVPGLKALNQDQVTVSLDKGCLIMKRQGQIEGSAVFPVPAEIGRMLPAAAQPAAPLDCSKPGVTHMPAASSAVPAVSAAAGAPLTITRIWNNQAGRQVVLGPYMPQARHRYPALA